MLRVLVIAFIVLLVTAYAAPDLLVESKYQTTVIPVNHFVPLAISIFNVGWKDINSVEGSIPAHNVNQFFDVKGALPFKVNTIPARGNVTHIVMLKLRRFPHDEGDQTTVAEIISTPVVLNYKDEEGNAHKVSSFYRQETLPHFMTEKAFSRFFGRADAFLVFFGILSIFTLPSLYCLIQIQNLYTDVPKPITKKATSTVRSDSDESAEDASAPAGAGKERAAKGAAGAGKRVKKRRE